MTLWFVLALMTAAATFAVLWPLGRKRTLSPGGSEVAVYRDQLDEIERDRSLGLIGGAEAEAARVEVSRRLLAAADAGAGLQSRDDSGTWRRRAAALTALVLLPLGAVGLYVVLGSPHLPAQPLAARVAASQADQSIENLVARVEAHLERDPNDGRGWEVVAPVYFRLGRFPEAVRARRQALALNGETAERQADLGEALAAAANGIVTAEAKAAFERAVALEAGQSKARFYLGLAAEQDGRRDEAASIWRALLASAPADAPWAPFVRQALARLGETVEAAPGPSAEDVAAASQLSESEQRTMIQGMVGRLAERLKQDGADVDGWIRLLRAYMVLGERDRALSAAADARRAVEGDAAKLRRLDEAVKGLGLEG